MVRRRRGGSWHEMREQLAESSAEYTPVWLVELPRGVTEVTASESETVDGARCRHLTARCDPSLAAQRSRHGMKLPEIGRESDTSDLFKDQRSVPTELWIDSAGCLRRVLATFQIGEPDEIIKETNGFKAELSLRDLGTAPAPAPPPETAAVRDGDRAASPPSP